MACVTDMMLELNIKRTNTVDGVETDHAAWFDAKMYETRTDGRPCLSCFAVRHPSVPSQHTVSIGSAMAQIRNL